MSDQPRFQCPACGKSFPVRSWYSERIYCGHWCANRDRQLDKLRGVSTGTEDA